MEEKYYQLDQEFQKYLQILRPYLGQLVDQDVINSCNTWILRLTNCSDTEKSLRNKYVFALCYQLSKGILEEPFLDNPPFDALLPISEGFESESSTEVEYVVIDANDNNTNVLFNSKKLIVSDTEYLANDNEFDVEKQESCEFESNNQMICDEQSSGPSRRQTIFCYTCPEIMNSVNTEIANDKYEYRANNLIMKLREIKKQNILLHNELLALKEESQVKPGDEEFSEVCLAKIDNGTNTFEKIDSDVTFRLMESKLHEEETKNTLMSTIAHLQQQLDNFNNIKNTEIEDMDARHKLEIIKIKSIIREESKNIYEEKLEELKQNYEKKSKEVEQNMKIEIQNLKMAMDKIINEKDNIIKVKDSEITGLKAQLEDQNKNLNIILNRVLEKKNDDSSSGSKMKTQELEKRLNRMEKSKYRCAKAFETKLAYLQREKHLAECSLQLQLVKQRAQVINEISNESQSTLSSALDKLENKYKEIVANVQATAIQRRMRDQLAIKAILQAACGTENLGGDRSEFAAKIHLRQREHDQTDESEFSRLRNRGESKLCTDSVTGYHLDGEKFGELFEKVYIPQRDTGDGPFKK